MAEVQFYEPQSVIAPDSSPILRSAPRPMHLRQDGFDDTFDATTVFYDVVYLRGEVVAMGPELREFGPLLAASTLSFDGVQWDGQVALGEGAATYRLTFPFASPPSTMRIETADWSVEIPIRDVEGCAEPFRGRRVLMTVSKNNRLEWLADWARFHVDTHGVDAVLIYDNSSTEYGLDELASTLADVAGLATATVASWPFRWGPSGGKFAGAHSIPWDSSYCQSGAMENARRVHLPAAVGVMNADIDELVISHSGRTVFEVMEQEQRPYLSYGGTWIEPVCDAPHVADGSRHADFVMVDRYGPPTKFKWTVDPRGLEESARWFPHAVREQDRDRSTEFSLAHFKPINTSWKFDRSERVDFDPEVHRINVETLAALQRVFPERFPSERVNGLLRLLAPDAPGYALEAHVPVVALALHETLSASDVDYRVRIDGDQIRITLGDVPWSIKALVHPEGVRLTVIPTSAESGESLRQTFEAAQIPVKDAKRQRLRVGSWTFSATQDVATVGALTASRVVELIQAALVTP